MPNLPDQTEPLNPLPHSNEAESSVLASPMRHIYLDLETTGIPFHAGHRIVEIGAVEVIDGRLTGKTFHTYLNPDHPVHPDALAVHGLTNEFLQDKPRFESIRASLEDFLADARLFIHNAKFDTPFLEAELERVGAERLWFLVGSVYDTLSMFNGIFPSERCDLQTLCSLLAIPFDSDLPGTLADATLLARLCGRVHAAAVLAWAPPRGMDSARFLDLVRRIESEAELPAEFGLAYLQHHLRLSYRRAIELMNQLCWMGMVEWTIGEHGELVFQLPRVTRSFNA